jgi:dihydroorotase
LKTTLIKGGRVFAQFDGANTASQLGDVAIKGDRVVSVGKLLPDFKADEVIDAHGHWVMPGIVDIAARLREPGFEFKAALESELKAAIRGGVTSVCCPPDTEPSLDEPGLVKMLKFRAKSLNQARVFPLGALTVGLNGEVITEMAELNEAGCVGFSQANVPVFDTQVLLRAMQYAKSFGFRLWIQPTDPYLSKGGVMHSGATATRMGLSGVPVSAEVVAIQTLLELVRNTGCDLHLCRLSSATGVNIVRAAKAEGLPITADVSIYHTLLIDSDIGFFDPCYRVVPPFRAQRDREAIWGGIADGTIDSICSDHTPVDADAKLAPFAEAQPGLTGLELLLPLALKCHEQSKVPIERLIQALTSAPGQLIRSGLYGVNPAFAPGQLKVGNVADVIMFDPQKNWIVSADQLLSQGKHTPYNKLEVSGQVSRVFVAGQARL